jgi:PKD repeat protein
VPLILQPTANSQQPTANSQQPTANSQQPTANSQLYLFKLFYMLLFLGGLFGHRHAKAQCNITPSGTVQICSGDTKPFGLAIVSPGYIYSWAIAPTTNANVLNIIGPSTNIYFQTAANYTITCTGVKAGSPNQVCTKAIVVNASPSPNITYNNQVGCFEPVPIDTDKLHAFSLILPPGNSLPVDSCIKVCSGSYVDYNGISMLGMSGSTFNWQVSGGLFTANNTTTLNNAPIANIIWGAPGYGYVKVIETNNGCVAEKTICIEIIPSPTAKFLVNLPTPMGGCYNICDSQTVYFTDVSIANSLSQIVSWDWDFGDGTPHETVQNPHHLFVFANQPNPTVLLTITNECNCKSTTKVCFILTNKQGPEINCPRVVCEGNKDVYCTNAKCGKYDWTAIGGDIYVNGHNVGSHAILPNNGQACDQCIEVDWNAVGASGFGSLTLDGATCQGVCTQPNTILVPVIAKYGKINGPTAVCAGAQYTYALPAWPATDFKWKLDNNNNGATIVGLDYNNHTVEVLVSNLPNTSFTLKCKYVNTLRGCEGIATLDINVKPQALIAGPTEICKNAPATFTLGGIPPSPGVTGTTTWTLNGPSGTQTFTNVGSVAITIPASAFATVGYYQLLANNGQSFCEPIPYSITVVAIPATPTFITGETLVCDGLPYTYNTGNPVAGTFFSWTTTPALASNLTATATGASITTIWNHSNFGGATAIISSYNISSSPAACKSLPFNLTVTKKIPNLGITGNNIPCEDGIVPYAITVNNSFAPFGAIVPEFIEWSLSNPLLGSITAGQGTNNVTITWNHMGSNTCIIKCEVTVCGIKSSKLYTVNIQASTTIATLTASSSPVCGGTPVTFTATSTGGAPINYIFDFGDGTTQTITSSATSVTSSPVVYNNNSNLPLNITVTVKATSSCNNNVSPIKTLALVVNPQPNINLTPGNVIACDPAISPFPTFSQPVALSNTSTFCSPFTIVWKYKPPVGAWQTSTATNVTTFTLTQNPSSVTSALAGISTTTTAGTYSVTVTNACGCSSVSSFTISYKPCNNTCTPTAPSGVTTTATVTSCGTASATASVLGTVGTNIWNFTWNTYVPAGVIVTTVGAPGTLTTSPTYSYSKPGQYQICLTVNYKTSIPTDSCPVTVCKNVTIPLIANFSSKLICTTGGYKLQFTDNCATFPGFTVANTRIWKINGTTVTGGGAVVTNTTALTPGTYTLSLAAITSPTTAGGACTITKTIVVPALPVANFSIASTDPLSTAGAIKTCKDRSIVFTNLSTPAAGISSNIWNFGDGTPSWIPSYTAPLIGKIYTATSNTYTVTLTVADAYGCTSTATKAVATAPNNINTLGVISASQTLCAGATPAPLSLTLPITGGTSPITYQWYNYNTPITGGTSVPYAPPVNMSGLFWFLATDAHACFKAINAPAVTINYQNPPTPAISGNASVCLPNPVKLSAICGSSNAGLTFSWTRLPAGFTASTATITDNTISTAGTFTYTCTVTNPLIPGCPATASYVVSTHAKPAPPQLTCNLISCAGLAVQLSVVSPPSPTQYNWSNGGVGLSTIVNTGGKHRCWYIDGDGCSSYNDINVPYPATSYFWRLPYGCDRFCDHELPLQVNAPASTLFDTWEWDFNGSLLPNNNPGQASGTSSVSDPLYLNSLGNGGSGTGQYTWQLGNNVCNSLCQSISHPWNVSVTECCQFDVVNKAIYCDSNTGEIMFIVNVYPNMSGCSNLPITYNLSLVDANGQPVGIWGTGSTGTIINNAPGTIVASYIPLVAPPFANACTLKVTTTCLDCKIGLQDCIGTLVFDMPDCTNDMVFKQAFTNGIQANNSNLSLAPNPNSGAVAISYNCNVPARQAVVAELYITDAMGKYITSLPITKGKGSISYNTQALTAGMYFVQLRHQGQILNTQKMIKE